MPETMTRARMRLPAAAALIAALGLASVAAPVAAGGVVVMLVGLVGATALVVFALWRSGSPPRATWPALGVLAAATGWMLLTAALSTGFRVSLIGWIGQHDGALLWVVALLAATGCAALAGPRELRALVISIAALGAVFALGAGLDAVGVLGRAGRFSTEPSGFLESSASLGQLLLLALACALAWLLFARSTGDRIGAAACLLLAGGGLVLAQSRAAWIGLAVGGGLAAALHRAGPRARRIAVVALAILALGSVALLPAVLSGRLGPGPATAADRLSNGRSVIWRTAVAVAAAAPVAGRGPDQFSSWVAWDVPESGGLRATGAYDPHDLMLYLLVSGGILGLLLGLAALAALLVSVLTPSADGRGGPGPTILAGGLIAWAAALVFAWVNPLAAVVAAALAGALMGALDRDGVPSEHAGERWPVARILASVTLLACVAALVPLVPAAVTEVRWAREEWAARGDVTALEAAYATHPDPGYAAEAMKIRMALGTDEDLRAGRRLAEAVAPMTERHVDAALASVGVWEAYGVRTGSDVDDEVFAALDAGKRADPASGLWDYVGALWASQRGDDATASSRAEAALTYPQPPVAEAWLRDLTAAEP